MKVLWFTNLPPAGGNAFDHWGGGWMRALQNAFVQRTEVDLGIAFFTPKPTRLIQGEDGGPYLFPLSRPKGFLSRAARFFLFSRQDRLDLSACQEAVRAFHPDIIHVFGTEKVFGLLAKSVDIPVVVHLQGLMVPYLNAWVPPGYRLFDYVRASGFHPFRLVLGFRALAFNQHAATREREIMRHCQFFMGRTEWDRAYVSLYAPQAHYFHCEEALRPEFFSPAARSSPKTPLFVSTLSGPLYKGHDVILKTAKVLCETGHDDFEWRVFGVDNIRFAERKTGIRASDVHVRPMGSIPAERLRDELLRCTAYVHPSYIDNSPNSVCEAQVLGVPVVATAVGGVSSIVDDGRTGFLVPANDPISLARKMVDLSLGTVRLPDQWQKGPRLRNDPAQVAERVSEVYREILSGK